MSAIGPLVSVAVSVAPAEGTINAAPTHADAAVNASAKNFTTFNFISFAIIMFSNGPTSQFLPPRVQLTDTAPWGCQDTPTLAGGRAMLAIMALKPVAGWNFPHTSTPMHLQRTN